MPQELVWVAQLVERQRVELDTPVRIFVQERIFLFKLLE